MKFLIPFIAILLATVGMTSCTKNKVSKVPSPEGYYENEWDTPLAAAQDYDRNVYVQFYAEWCSLCASFKEDVLNDPEVESYTREKFVPVLLDAEKGVGLELWDQHGFTNHPLSVIFDKDGNIVAERPGRMDKETFLAWIKDYE